MTDTCPICDTQEITKVIRRAHTPVLLNRFYPTPTAARAAPRGNLEFVACKACGFTWNRAFDAGLVAYDDAYENDVTHSPVFQRHLADRAADVAAALPEGPLDYLEVGCGQGHFIAALAAASGKRLRSATGFDPAWRGAEGTGPAGSRIRKAFFDRSSRLEYAPNLVASRHTIEHIVDPVDFLRGIRAALGAASTAEIFVETPCVDWIVRHGALQDFFYEHCSLFTAHALALALARAGFAARAVRHVFGGQYLWAQATAAGAETVVAPAPIAPAPIARAPIARAPIAPAQHVPLGANMAHWQARARSAAQQGPVAVWGAGAKGVTFALMVDPDGTLLDHAIDINPGKQAQFLPGSGLPVLAPEAAARRGPKTIFVMNENYLSEIADTARRLRIEATFIPLA